MIMKNVKMQKGFALVVVLITLMILSLVVASLLRNQTLALQETSILMIAAQNEQESHNAHQACVNQVKLDLVSAGIQSAPVVWANLNTNGFNLQANGNTVACNVLIPVTPAAGAWTPMFQLSTTIGTITETTTWQYSPCVAGQPCQIADSPLQIASNDGLVVSVIPTWVAGSTVQVSWQRM